MRATVIDDGPKLTPVFTLRLRAQTADIDELNHVSNIVYVRWLQDVAVAHSTSVGWSPDAYLKLGSVFVVRRHAIDYLGAAIEGDELELSTWLSERSKASSLRLTRITRVSDGRSLLRAETLWAFVSAKTGRPQRVPEEIVEAFLGPQKT